MVLPEVIDYIFEIQKDPFKWVLEHTAQGYDKLRLLTFLSIVSSQMRVGHIHLLPIGEPNDGVVTTIKSVLRLIEPSKVLVTPQSLSSVDSLDGKVFFVERINTYRLYYIRDMIDYNMVYVGKTQIKHIVGQPSIIVANPPSNDRDCVFNKFLKVYVKPEVVDRIPVVSELDELAFTSYLLSLPKYADITPVLDRTRDFLVSIGEYTRYPITRIAEMLRNLTIATTIARGKTTVSEEDLDFVLKNFQPEVIYSGLGLTSLDLKIIKLLSENERLKAREITETLKTSKRDIGKILRSLRSKGFIDAERRGSTLIWYLTPLGHKVKVVA